VVDAGSGPPLGDVEKMRQDLQLYFALEAFDGAGGRVDFLNGYSVCFRSVKRRSSRRLDFCSVFTEIDHFEE
jgi:hypothetical protein